MCLFAIVSLLVCYRLATDVGVSENLLPQPISGKDVSRIIDYLEGLNHWKLTCEWVDRRVTTCLFTALFL